MIPRLFYAVIAAMLCSMPMRVMAESNENSFSAQNYLDVSPSVEHPVEYCGEVIANAGGGEFAPYYLMSNNFGVLTQPYSMLARISAKRTMDLNRRFSWGFGADVIGGFSSSRGYERFSIEDNSMVMIQRRPAAVRLQQLYGEVKYRSLFLTAGLKEVGSAMLNDRLSSGDLTWSANARPIPGVRAGFHGFENIPFTNGWVQINGELFYGRPSDNHWLEDHYNYENYFVTTGRWINYKRLYLRTNPHQPVSVTVGMQAAAIFGGTQNSYNDGRLVEQSKSSLRLGDFIDMLIPRQGDSYWTGNHLGSWDFKSSFRVDNKNELIAYFQWPWEDGSGIGKLNGFDGLWGVEYKRAGSGIVTGAVIEYLDFTNQSGPLHWDPEDFPGTTIVDWATGSDDYYNHFFYNGYAYYGLSQGTPFMTSPIYNRDGYMRFVDNKVRGFHVAVEGEVSRAVDYRAMFSWRQAWGSGYIPRVSKVSDTSAMLEVKWWVPSVAGLSVKGAVAIDRGEIFGNNAGVSVTVAYKGDLKIWKL